MPRKRHSKPTTRRSYDDEFKAEADQMLLDGHSAQSIVNRLGISGTNLLYRWKKQHLEAAGPVGEVLDSRVGGRGERINEQKNKGTLVQGYSFR